MHTTVHTVQAKLQENSGETLTTFSALQQLFSQEAR